MRLDITDKATVSVLSSFGYWLEPSALPPNELVSGKRYAIRVSAPGYESEEQSISVGVLQTTAFFQASLLPIQGRLSIVSALAGIKITIDGMDRVVSGDASRSRQDLRLSESRPLNLSLSPGPIRIDARSGGRKGSGEITVKSGEELTIIIKAGPGPNSLAIKELE
jgi:hypothetical protein